ncbi:WD40 repeat domain-containing protein, partial [archaeon]
SMGTVYRARPLATSLYTPLAVRTTLEAHATSVTCVAASPFLRNLVLSASADGTVRVCSALDRAPLLCLTQHVGFQIVPTLAVDWSTLRPAVFAASSASGAVFIYDLYTSTAKPAVVLLPDGSSVVMSGPGASSSAAASLPSYLTATSSFGAAHMRIPLAFNPQTACHLAAGSSSGAVHVWQLGGRFGSTQPQELALMKDFVLSTMTDAGRVIVASSRGGAMLEERGVSSKGGSDDAAPNSLGVFLQRVEEKTAAARSLL